MSIFRADNSLLVAMEPALKRRLRRRAKREEVSMGEYVRKAVEEKLKRDRDSSVA
jgi:hypothetical protein